jgi:tetratricopeptide (TPR) repeat protein
MTRPETTPHRSAAEVATAAAACKRRNDWEPLAALAAELPPQWGRDWLPVAADVAFALGQLGRNSAARDVLERAYDIDPCHRTASALAYVHYDALLRHKVRKPRLDEPEPWRKGFERWIAEALRRRPDSIADRYRLGVYHGSIQIRKDALALRAFRDVLDLFERLPAPSRTPQSRHWKNYVRALYGAARSAHRLGRTDEARRWIFRCIRLDRERNHVAPVFKLFLAAKVLVAQNQLEHAERALRLAAAAPHHGDRDFVYAQLAEVALRQNRIDDAASWIELHVRPHHRKPYVWRLLGDCEARRDRAERARKLYKSALLKDRGGRHKTLLRIGALDEAAERWNEARRAYEQAADFCRRRYLRDDPYALEALARVSEKAGDLETARGAYARMAKMPALAARAQRELKRLAG